MSLINGISRNRSYKSVNSCQQTGLIIISSPTHGKITASVVSDSSNDDSFSEVMAIINNTDLNLTHNDNAKGPVYKMRKNDHKFCESELVKKLGITPKTNSKD